MTDAEIVELIEELDVTEEQWRRAAYLATPVMPCPECGGQGAVYGGVLGDYCPTCDGARVVEAPDAESIEAPPFGLIRQTLGNARLGLAAAGGGKIALPGGGLVDPSQLALPAPEVLEGLREQMRLIAEQATELAKRRASHPETASLPKYRAPAGMLGDGDLGDVTDAELDEIQDGE